jgi:hypothetical protein
MADSAPGPSRQAVVSTSTAAGKPPRNVTPIASLAVGIVGCWVCVQVIDEDSIRHIEKADTYKALWVVADAAGTAINMDAWNKDQSKLEELVAKLPLGGTVIIDGFHVQKKWSRRRKGERRNSASSQSGPFSIHTEHTDRFCPPQIQNSR